MTVTTPAVAVYDLVTDLDAWTTDLQATTGIPCTRDPDLVSAPCLFIGFPEAGEGTQGLINVALDVPVWLVAPGTGMVAANFLLTALPDVLQALSRKTFTVDTLTVGGYQFDTYKFTARLVVCPTP